MDTESAQGEGGIHVRLRRRGLVLGGLGALAASLFGKTEAARGAPSAPGVAKARSVTGPFLPAAFTGKVFDGKETGALGGYSHVTAIYGLSTPTTTTVTATTLFQQPTVGLMGQGTDEPTIVAYTFTGYGGVLGIGDDYGVAGGVGAPPPGVLGEDAGVVAWAANPQTPALWGYNPSGVGLCVDGALSFSSASRATLRAGTRTPIVRDPDVGRDSLVFGQLGSNPGNSPHIISIEPANGRFTVRLSEPARRATTLNYLILEGRD